MEMGEERGEGEVQWCWEAAGELVYRCHAAECIGVVVNYHWGCWPSTPGHAGACEGRALALVDAPGREPLLPAIADRCPDAQPALLFPEQPPSSVSIPALCEAM